MYKRVKSKVALPPMAITTLLAIMGGKISFCGRENPGNGFYTCITVTFQPYYKPK